MKIIFVFLFGLTVGMIGGLALTDVFGERSMVAKQAKLTEAIAALDTKLQTIEQNVDAQLAQSRQNSRAMDWSAEATS